MIKSLKSICIKTYYNAESMKAMHFDKMNFLKKSRAINFARHCNDIRMHYREATSNLLNIFLALLLI